MYTAIKRKHMIAIDLCSFSEGTQGCGKHRVADTLFRGFTEIGVGNNIICFCHKELVDILLPIVPETRIYVVPMIKSHKLFQRTIRAINYLIHLWYETVISMINNVGIIMFTDKLTPYRKSFIKTAMITNDIKVFENRLIPGVNYIDHDYNYYTRRIKRDFKYRDYVIAISDYDKQAALKYLPWAESKLTRIYNPIIFNDNIDSTVQKKKYITVVNIQYLHKNVITILKAFKEICNKTELNLLVVGKERGKRAGLERYVEENNLQDRVIFTGYVSDEALDKIIAKTRIYINASYFEGFGMTAVEMMGRKVPTIVANNTAQLEVTKGLCRYYSPTDDSHALAEQILDELEHPTSREELEEISKQIVAEYNYIKIAQEYWDKLTQWAQED